MLGNISQLLEMKKKAESKIVERIVKIMTADSSIEDYKFRNQKYKNIQ